MLQTEWSVGTDRLLGFSIINDNETTYVIIRPLVLKTESRDHAYESVESFLPGPMFLSVETSEEVDVICSGVGYNDLSSFAKYPRF